MKKTLYSFLFITLGTLALTSCDKEDVTELPSAPISEVLPVAATLTRTIHYTVKGTHKDTTYTTANQIITSAGFGYKTLADTEKNAFYVSFDAGPRIINTDGDYIHFAIDKGNLKEGYVGNYTVGAAVTNPVYDIHYAYYSKTINGILGSLHNLRTGLQMVGNLKIDSYDKVRNTISGSYTMAASLNTDPVKIYTHYMDPEDKCALNVSGTFSNVKIRQD